MTCTRAPIGEADVGSRQYLLQAAGAPVKSIFLHDWVKLDWIGIAAHELDVRAVHAQQDVARCAGTRRAITKSHNEAPAFSALAEPVG